MVHKCYSSCLVSSRLVLSYLTGDSGVDQLPARDSVIPSFIHSLRTSLWRVHNGADIMLSAGYKVFCKQLWLYPPGLDSLVGDRSW